MHPWMFGIYLLHWSMLKVDKLLLSEVTQMLGLLEQLIYPDKAFLLSVGDAPSRTQIFSSGPLSSEWSFQDMQGPQETCAIYFMFNLTGPHKILWKAPELVLALLSMLIMQCGWLYISPFDWIVSKVAVIFLLQIYFLCFMLCICI